MFLNPFNILTQNHVMNLRVAKLLKKYWIFHGPQSNHILGKNIIYRRLWGARTYTSVRVLSKNIVHSQIMFLNPFNSSTQNHLMNFTVAKLLKKYWIFHGPQSNHISGKNIVYRRFWGPRIYTSVRVLSKKLRQKHHITFILRIYFID